MYLTFVCSGNTCRSPLAVAAWSVVAREMSEQCREILATVTVESAGLNARRATPATAMAQLIAAGWDADLSEHQSRIWRPDTRVRGAQLFVTMTREQAAQVRFQLQMQAQTEPVSVEVLGAFVAAPRRQNTPSWDETNQELEFDIPDPYGGSSEAYEECGARILRAVRALAQSLCRDELKRTR